MFGFVAYIMEINPKPGERDRIVPGKEEPAHSRVDYFFRTEFDSINFSNAS